jgi:hypothetical protein
MQKEIVFSYIAGQSIGRLFMAYLMVWLICLIIKKGQIKAAFQCSRRWYFILLTLVFWVIALFPPVIRFMQTQ